MLGLDVIISMCVKNKNTSTGSSRLNKGTLEFDPTLLPYLTLARTDTSKYLSLLTGTADTVFTQDMFLKLLICG